MKIIGTLPSNRKFEAKLEGSTSLFMHVKSGQSVNHDMNTRLDLHVRFGFKK